MQQLAAYLDGALDGDARAAVRGHVLSCGTCAARLERLRDDSRRLQRTLSAAPAPDVRPALRGRLRRAPRAAWLGRATALAGALLALLLFALLVGGGREGGTLARSSDRLFVVDRRQGQLVELSPTTGEQLRSLAVGAGAAHIRYSPRLGLLFVRTAEGATAIDPEGLVAVARWEAPAPIGLDAGMALDDTRRRLYVAGADGIVALDAATLTPLAPVAALPAPGPIAITADGRRLFAVGGEGRAVWAIDLADQSPPQRVGQVGGTAYAWLSSDPDGGRVYALRADAPPRLWALDGAGAVTAGAAAIAPLPRPQDLLALGDGRLAIARGDGTTGGVELLSAETLTTAGRLEPDYDQHNLVAGRDGALFALNWLHGTVTRYRLEDGARLWQVALPGLQPYDGVLVRGGWRWPWE